MSESSRRVSIGLHSEDDVEMEVFTRGLLTLRVRGQSGDRVRTSLLTREQAVSLRDALSELIESLGPEADADEADSTRLRAA